MEDYRGTKERRGRVDVWRGIGFGCRVKKQQRRGTGDNNLNMDGWLPVTKERDRAGRDPRVAEAGSARDGNDAVHGWETSIHLRLELGLDALPHYNAAQRSAHLADSGRQPAYQALALALAESCYRPGSWWKPSGVSSSLPVSSLLLRLGPQAALSCSSFFLFFSSSLSSLYHPPREPPLTKRRVCPQTDFHPPFISFLTRDTTQIERQPEVTPLPARHH